MTAIFITGTDTDVGKTIVSAIFLAHALRFGSASYHKPIQTALESDCDARTVRSLLAPTAHLHADYGLGLLRPLAPLWSAHYQKVTIDFNDVIKKARQACMADITIIEGSGGALVPITDQYLMTDLMQALQIPVVLVARSKLGTINHTLLSLEALRRRDISVAGVVMVGPLNEDNEESIRIFGKIPVIFSVPVMPTIDILHISNMALSKEDQLKAFFSRL